MQGEQQQIKTAAREVGAKVKETTTGNVGKVVQQATKGKKTAKDVLGLTDAMVEGIYGQAYRLYNTGKYKDACQIFRLLLMLNATEVKFAMGLSACFHMMKDYEAAIGAYTLVSTIDANNPLPFYHSSDCYAKIGDPVGAAVSLEMAIKRAGTKPEYRTIRDRAKLTLEALRKEIASRGTGAEQVKS